MLGVAPLFYVISVLQLLSPLQEMIQLLMVVLEPVPKVYKSNDDNMNENYRMTNIHHHPRPGK